ncbi:hypothetical protein EZS27_006319 [termite gut metagenome]|uniref:Uncharacterized protein n=1 Tax=termite gut metagenome TaxID=433724 RepID=A0A5J4SJ64_9ZZZZ
MNAQKEHFLFTILYLMSEYSNKRQGIKEITNVDIYPSTSVVDAITNHILGKYQFNLNNISSPEEYLKAETYLGEYLSDIIRGDLSASIEDENLLLTESIEVTKDYFIPAEIKEIQQHIKNIFSEIKITLSGINSFFLHPDYIRYFKIEQNENLLCTKVIPYKNTKKILFYHMYIYRILSDITGYDVSIALVVDYDKFKDMLSSPVRLFLFILDNYGIDIDLNGETKKLFFRTKKSPDNTHINVTVQSKQYYTCFQQFKDDNNETYLSFLYGINVATYIDDFKRNEI